MLSLFHSGELPLKRINGMELYRFGNRIDPLWRITKENTYKDIRRICEEARLELNHLLDGSDYSHVLDLSKKPVERLIRNLSGFLKFRQDKNEAIGEFEYKRLQENLREFEDKYSIDVKKGLMFVCTPKGTHDIRLLLENGEVDFPEELKSVCPEAIPDIRAATRCLVYEEFTACVFHFHRANESVIKRYMKFKNLVVPDNGYLRRYISAIKTVTNLPDGLIHALETAKKQRNPIMHPNVHVKDFEEANAMYLIVYTTIRLIVSDMV